MSRLIVLPGIPLKCSNVVALFTIASLAKKLDVAGGMWPDPRDGLQLFRRERGQGIE